MEKKRNRNINRKRKKEKEKRRNSEATQGRPKLGRRASGKPRRFLFITHEQIDKWMSHHFIADYKLIFADLMHVKPT